jgi:glycosyltransferase involved in cell wall biosynthesis
VLGSRHDALLYCNAANAIFTWMPRVLGMPVALNVDGLERNRKKWNRLARAWYRVSEWLATWMPNAVVTDAKVIADYYRDRYRRDSEMIPYGAETGALESQSAFARLGLERRKFFLYVSRMEPENNALLVREAFERMATDYKLSAGGRRAVRRRVHPRGPRHQGSACDSARGRSMGWSIASWVRTASPTFMRPRSAARIRR